MFYCNALRYFFVKPAKVVKINERGKREEGDFV
jgi:hypothetical protein